jgi:hypothetical protein
MFKKKRKFILRTTSNGLSACSRAGLSDSRLTAPAIWGGANVFYILFGTGSWESVGVHLVRLWRDLAFRRVRNDAGEAH